MRELPYTIKLPEYKAVIVHAGLVPMALLHQQTPWNMCTIRNAILQSDQSFIGTEKTVEGEDWAKVWSDYAVEREKKGLPTEHIYFGHDAKRGLQLHPFATGLDSGCCYGKSLSAVILPSCELVQVKAAMIYQPVKED